MRRRRSFLTDLLLPATMQLDHRLIVALDMTDGGPARSVTRAVRDRIDAVKVGWPLVLGAGVGIVRELAELAYVLCDFKIADIPNTSRLVAEQAVAAGASGVICHGFAGEDSVRACVEAAGRADASTPRSSRRSSLGSLSAPGPPASSRPRRGPIVCGRCVRSSVGGSSSPPASAPRAETPPRRSRPARTR